MAWRIVQQPDGLFAVFSEVVDSFTIYDMTYDEAIQECQEHMGKKDAIIKVQRGIAGGNERWQEALQIIRHVHGKQALRNTVNTIIRKEHEKMQ